MSPQIEILELVLLFAAIVLFTFGIAGLRFNQTNKPYFKFTFAAVLVLSFISLQTAIFIYFIKFDFYFGWNAALLILVLTIMITSPFFIMIINSVKELSLSPGKTFRQIQKLEIKKDAAPKLTEEEKPIETHVFAELPKLTEESVQINTAVDQTPVEITPEKEEIREVTTSAVTPAEEKIIETAPKKAPAKKKAPVRKAPAKKHTAKTKPRRKK